MGRDRFAQQLLSWEWRGVQLEAAIPRCTYFCRAHRREVFAWCELRDISGGRRVEIGSFPSVAAAKAACERDAAARCRRDREATAAGNSAVVDVRIAPGRRRAAKAGKGRQLDYRPADAGDALADALRAFADVVGDEG